MQRLAPTKSPNSAHANSFSNHTPNLAAHLDGGFHGELPVAGASREEPARFFAIAVFRNEPDGATTPPSPCSREHPAAGDRAADGGQTQAITSGVPFVHNHIPGPFTSPLHTLPYHRGAR